MKKLAFVLGISIAIFVSANFASATHIIDDALHVNSLKVGQDGVGGVTYFNGTIINETTTNGAGNPVTFGDDVRIDGRLYRGATAGTSDSKPFIINDNLEVVGSLTVGSTNILSRLSSLGTTDASLQSQITSLGSTDTSLQSQISTKGVGDMLKSTYDVAGNSKIDAGKLDSGIAATLIGSGGVSNAQFGYITGLNLNNDTNMHLTALGINAGDEVLTTGIDNTFIGYHTGDANSAGDDNTAVGSNALGALTLGDRNTAIGKDAIPTLESVSDNTGVGYMALYSMITGQQNTAIGNEAMAGGRGSNNTALGYKALYSTENNYNIGIGHQAGSGISTGQNNIAIGTSAGNNISSGDDNIIIGNQPTISMGASDYLNIGDTILGSLADTYVMHNEALNVVNDENGKTLTVGETNSIQTNAGAGDGWVWNLPEASQRIGMVFTFTVMANEFMSINPDNADQILGLTNAVGDAIQNNTIGNTITLMAVDNTNWVVAGNYGTWTDAN